MTLLAQWILLGLLAASMVFHMGILFRLIPYQIVWGGRLKSEADMYRFEAVSLLINALFISVVLVHMQVIPLPVPILVRQVSLWVIAGLFLLNTLGNAVSKNRFEKLFFTPLTLLMALLAAVAALNL